MELALEQLKGTVNGYKLQVQYEDSACSPLQATNTVKRVLDQFKPHIVIGEECSDASLAIAPILEQNKVVQLNAGSVTMDKFSLKGKAAIVTGAAGGIGGAIAKAFKEAGAQVACVDLAVDQAAKTFGGLHVLVNAAAMRDANATVTDIDLPAWNRVFGVNVAGAYLMSRWAIPHMLFRKQNWVHAFAGTTEAGHFLVKPSSPDPMERGSRLPPLPASTRTMNSSTARLNASGSSRLIVWPDHGMTTRPAVGMVRFMRSPGSRHGSSSSPVTTSVGTSIFFMSDRKSVV